jgi:hypothetical protein
VETVVQVLQHLETGSHDAQPKVEQFLKGLESRPSSLPDGLRVCASRIARAMYSLRSKRGIVHKSTVEPSRYDLRFLYAGAQWTLAELLALVTGVTAAEAGRLIEQVQTPATGLVEVLGGRRLVHGDMTVREEVLVLLLSHYPDPVKSGDVTNSLDRRSAGTVRNALSTLWKEKLAHRDAAGYMLTQPGVRAAEKVVAEHAD